MSTHAFVGVVEGGEVLYIYNHFDGYPEYLLKTLDEHYNTKEKAQELISMGDASYIDSTLEKSDFYHRDRGEELRISKAYIWEDGNCTLRTTRGAEYRYIFDGEWKMLSTEK